MSPSEAARQELLSLERHLAEVLVRGGLAELVPLKQRGRFSTPIGLVLLLLGAVGWLGLPLRDVAVGLVLGLTIEALDYYRQQRGRVVRALLRPSLWARIRPSFYWPLAVSTGLSALLQAEAPFLESLLRGAFQWLCFRIIEDLGRHPERYRSWSHFLSWVRCLGRPVAGAIRAWIRFGIAGILISVVLNLSAVAIWESVGHTSWSRLLVFGIGLYLIAVITFVTLLRSMVRSAVPKAVERWEGIRARDLTNQLRFVLPRSGVAGMNPALTELLEQQLTWKHAGNLVCRVGTTLEAALLRRYRRTDLFTSTLTLVLAALLIAMSVFLIVPRDVMGRWTTSGQAEELDLVLALDDLGDLFSGEFWDRILDRDWSDLAQEPLAKVAFLEAVVIVSLFMLETASGRLVAELDPGEMHRWLALGTTYLILLERKFQYMYSGFITRQLMGAKALRSVSMQNEVLLVPFAKRKVSVYKGICDFLDVYELPGWGSSPFVIAIFESYSSAQEWALKFLRFSSPMMRRPYDLERKVSSEPDALPERCWIWTGNRLVALSSFEEARRYARFVALYTH